MLRDVFGFKHVDAGGGWLIFDLPPSEIGVHPVEGPADGAGTGHRISFMCDDIHRTIAELRAKGVIVDGEPKDQGYGIVTMLKLPGGCDVMLYEPRHAIAAGMTSAGATKRSLAARKAAKTKSAKRTSAKMKPARKSAARRLGPRR